MNDDPKAAPSLADEFAAILDSEECRTYDTCFLNVGHWAIKRRDAILAALRALEAVRVYRPDLDDSDASYVQGYRHAIEAMQALLPPTQASDGVCAECGTNFEHDAEPPYANGGHAFVSTKALLEGER